MRHPERLVGYGIIGALESQYAVEIVDTETVSDDALALAQELFEHLGKGVCLVENVPGLYLGRVIGSIVNEAVIAVQEGVASADDVDTAMRLGVNYPQGPIAWGREIGGRRLTQILRRVAEAEGEAFAPHRALWVLDVQEEEEEAETDART
jgi:3-hydroxybutyryl-CoA dehydrogenase